jgi:hypothetical protein
MEECNYEYNQHTEAVEFFKVTDREVVPQCPILSSFQPDLQGVKVTNCSGSGPF